MRLRALLVLCGVALSGCDSNPAQPTQAACTFSLSSTSVVISAAGGTGSVTVSTAGTCTWEARSNVPWITAASGPALTGPGAFTFTVAAAPDSSARTGTLTVASQTVTVTQQGQACAVALLPPSRSFDALGGTAAFDVNTPPACAWTSAATAPWLTLVSGQAGTGNGTVTYAVAPYPEASSRTANVTVGDAAHAVTQSGVTGCSLAIDPDDGQFPVGGGSGTFDVIAAPTCAWFASSRSGWIRVLDPPGGLGAGSRRVSYSLDANGDAGTRTGTITVGAQAFVATQAGTSTCRYAATPVYFRECETGGWKRAVTVDTAAGCGWTASSDAPWILIESGRTGLGPGSIGFTFTSNYDAARQDAIKIRWPAPTEGQNVRIVQEGCDYLLSPAYVSVPACGGDRAFDVYSGSTDTGFCGHVGPMGLGRCVWSALSTVSWITVLTPMPIYGEEGRVTIRVAANDNWRERTAAITVQYRKLTVWQGPGPCRDP
jgi:Putative binding domain, N-terminal/Viral BACON domain